MKVLSIGNEMSFDIQAFFMKLSRETDENLLLASLFLEGASVEDHYRNYIDENEVYVYASYLPGADEPICPDGIALHEAVEDEDWNIITIQQNISLSGDIESCRPYLAELIAYIKLMHPQAKIMLIEPWAYEQGRQIKEFSEKYRSDQGGMFELIHECCITLCDEAQADSVIPIGTAWQIVRKSDIGDKLTIDGERANELGNFLSACCLYKAVFNKNSTDTAFTMAEFDERISAFLKLCADSSF